jgi:p-cumate 2,3-dioxygenase beta subunit
MTMTLSRGEVEDFLYAEAALLDAWRLDEWLALWTADGRYVVPATDSPAGDPRTTLALVADDLPQLRARVQQLASGATWAEAPRSRTQRMITNVRIVERIEERENEPAALRVASSFVVHRFRRERSDAFVGTYEHELVIAEDKDAGLRIRGKRCVLAHDSLFAQGSVGLIL